MKKTTARAARPARTPKQRIPIGLQLAAKIMDAVEHDHGWMLKKLAAADAHAIRLLEDPLVRMEIDGANAALGQLADANGAEETAERIAAAIPESVTHDPHAWITDNAVCWGKAGLYLGLCLGWRLTAALNSQGGGR